MSAKDKTPVASDQKTPAELGDGLESALTFREALAAKIYTAMVAAKDAGKDSAASAIRLADEFITLLAKTKSSWQIEAEKQAAAEKPALLPEKPAEKPKGDW